MKQFLKMVLYAFCFFARADVGQQLGTKAMYPLVSTTSFASATVISLASLNNKTKNINNSGLYQIGRTDSFAPKSVATGSPMFKITGSAVVIDLNGMEINNLGTTSAGYIGIEIGYAPSEIGSATQPSEVIIQNGTLTNFDIGILVHAGVKNVLLKNMQINKSSVGVVCMGKSGATQNNAVIGCTLENVRITGHALNRHAALVNLKTRIETGSGNYNYGANTFMPLRDDVIAGGDTNDVYTYYGVLATYVRNLALVSCVVHAIGYDSTGEYDEAEGLRTEAVGVAVRHGVHLLCEGCYIENCVSQQKAVSLQLESTRDVIVRNCACNSNTSQIKSVGIECYQEVPSGYNVENIVIENSQCNVHNSETTSYGIDASFVRDLTIINSTCNRNYADQTVMGFYSNKLHFATMKNCAFSANYTAESSLESDAGALACGIYLQGQSQEDISSISLEEVQACSNVGKNSGRGVYIKNASSCSCDHVVCSLNEGTDLRTDESTDLLIAQENGVISRHLPVLTQTGGVGLWLEGVEHSILEEVQASYNKGVRATGILLRNCQGIQCSNCHASSQQATGDCFSSTLALQTPATLGVQPEQLDLLFGGAAITSINATVATDDFLTKVGLVVADHASAETYANMKMILSSMLLLQAGVARFRLWGTAVGFHAHDVVGLFIENLHALKNSSQKDSAVGLAFTGQVQGCEVHNSSLSYNTAWTDSVRTASAHSYNYTFELASVYPFWNMLANAGDLTGDGQWDEATGIADAGFESGAAPTHFVAQGESQDVRLVTTARNLVNPVGPMACGCLLADAALDVVLDSNLVHSNNGNSGSAFGIALATAFSCVLTGNAIFNTSANRYGIAYGIVDFTTHSATVALNNQLAGNRWAEYTNANYIMPFNAGDAATLSYQTTSTYNGNLSNADSMNSVENLDIKYSTDDTYFYDVQATTDPFVTTDFVTQWDDENWTA